jgi:hypothetical protein
MFYSVWYVHVYTGVVNYVWSSVHDGGLYILFENDPNAQPYENLHTKVH